MLFGTPIFFRLAYFFTAFAPALLLLDIRASQKLFKDFKIFIFNAGELMILIMTILIILSGIYLKNYLKRQQEDEDYRVKGIVISFNLNNEKLLRHNYQIIEVQKGAKINSGFIAFAISIVTPSLLFDRLKNDDFLIALGIIILFFLLLMMSNDVFPNIILPIFGIQLMVTADNYNIFYFSKKIQMLSGIKALNYIGTAKGLSRTFVITDREIYDEEILDSLNKDQDGI